MDKAREGYTSRSMILGKLLLEAKALHPEVKDFNVYLRRVDGLHQTRAYELLALAGGRKTEADLKKESRERQQRHRIKQKTKPTLPKPEPKKPEPPPPPPKPFRDVTEKNPSRLDVHDYFRTIKAEIAKAAAALSTEDRSILADLVADEVQEQLGAKAEAA